MRKAAVELDAMMPLIRERLAQGDAVRFTPRGISMRPMLEGGRDQVILSPLPARLKKYDVPLYRRENGQYVLHRVVKAEACYTCIGDNQFVYETGLTHAQMIAVVSGFVRKGKLYTVDAFGYRVYCRVWWFSRPVRYFAVRVWGRLRRIFGRK